MSQPSEKKSSPAAAAHSAAAPALWQQLEAAAQALHGILGGQSSKATPTAISQKRSGRRRVGAGGEGAGVSLMGR